MPKALLHWVFSYRYHTCIVHYTLWAKKKHSRNLLWQVYFFMVAFCHHTSNMLPHYLVKFGKWVSCLCFNTKTISACTKCTTSAIISNNKRSNLLVLLNTPSSTLSCETDTTPQHYSMTFCDSYSICYVKYNSRWLEVFYNNYKNATMCRSLPHLPL